MSSHKKYLRKSRTKATYELPESQKVLQEKISKLSGVVAEDPLAWSHGLCVRVAATDALELFEKLKSEEFAFEMLVDVTAVDYLDSRDSRFEVVYQLMSISNNQRLCVKISAEEDSPSVPSLCGLWRSANFMEREVFDMFGINFEGHPDQRRILMYDEFVGHPLRKDYPVRGKQPRVQLRIPELRNTSADLRKEELVSLPVRRS